MALKRMDNVLIVVEDLEAVKAFFIELGLELEGQTTVEGPLIGDLIGLKDVRATLAMLRPPDGQGGIELDKFHTPDPVRYGPVNTPVNALGIRRVMFNVDGIDDVVARMRAHGAEIIGEMRYEDSYRLAYIRGPEGIIVGLAEETRKAPPRAGKGAVRSKPVSRAKPAVRKKTGPAARKSSGAKISGGAKKAGTAKKKRKT
jgi:catechol 2,3-dioxygenase-like lactoylglutathione lyase family enzyme